MIKIPGLEIFLLAGVQRAPVEGKVRGPSQKSDTTNQFNLMIKPPSRGFQVRVQPFARLYCAVIWLRLRSTQPSALSRRTMPTKSKGERPCGDQVGRTVGLLIQSCIFDAETS